MSRNLSFIICDSIYYPIKHKEDIESQDYINNIKNKLSKYFDLSLYDINILDKDIEFKIKDNVLTKNSFLEFIETQKNLLPKEYYDEIIHEKWPSADNEFFKYILDNESCYSHYSCDTMYIDSNRVKFQGYSYYTSPEAYLDCYKDLFYYISNLIKISTDHPLARTVKLLID